MICSTFRLAVAIAICMFVGSQANSEVALYGKCGGLEYTGPTTCAQPTFDPLYSQGPPQGIVSAIVCKKYNEYHSQCEYTCPADTPCIAGAGSLCVVGLGTNGLGRKYCPAQTYCGHPTACFSNSVSCLCGGSVPCKRDTRPGGCVALESDGTCPKYTTSCL